MTEKKRFTIEPTMMRECIVDNFTGEQLDTFDYTERLCELLNALNEENTDLKIMLNQCQDQRNEFHRGARENANEVGKLEKENKRLTNRVLECEAIIYALKKKYGADLND